jgi:hypothetical protein
MEDKDRKVSVKNRSAATTIISIPNRNINITLAPGQVVNTLTAGDIEEFSYQPGGDKMLREYLQLSLDEIDKLALGEPQPEYAYTEQDVINLLKPATPDNFDLLLDCLDFAPIGVIDLVKKYAVDLPLTDTRKLEAIKEKTGFDVAAAIRHVEEEKMESQEEKKGPTRRVAAEPKKEVSAVPVRRVIRK